ncbi:hypothetical protein bthur0004_64550 [Bacillus thuringiensis serovar sotto str. T04001]|nr:hypothetical protein bthur0004_64550 [Bacillus thuringiensis serovar sotto str. T04001]
MKDNNEGIEGYSSIWDALDFWTKFFFIGTAILCGIILLMCVQYLFN